MAIPPQVIAMLVPQLAKALMQNDGQGQGPQMQQIPSPYGGSLLGPMIGGKRGGEPKLEDLLGPIPRLFM